MYVYYILVCSAHMYLTYAVMAVIVRTSGIKKKRVVEVRRMW